MNKKIVLLLSGFLASLGAAQAGQNTASQLEDFGKIVHEEEAFQGPENPQERLINRIAIRDGALSFFSGHPQEVRRAMRDLELFSYRNIQIQTDYMALNETKTILSMVFKGSARTLEHIDLANCHRRGSLDYAKRREEGALPCQDLAVPPLEKLKTLSLGECLYLLPATLTAIIQNAPELRRITLRGGLFEADRAWLEITLRDDPVLAYRDVGMDGNDIVVRRKMISRRNEARH